MTTIHSTAVVSPKAMIGQDVVIGPYTVIEDGVEIGDGSQIASSVLIATGARLGKKVTVAHGAVIGTVPQDLKFSGEDTLAIIGDGTTVREYATINRGTKDHWKTTIGRNCLIMAYAHVAHDCQIGDQVILANSVNLAGHVEIGDFAILGGVLPVHQFVKIGVHAMIGGGFRVQQDVGPYALAGGYPLRVVGLNAVGLRRRDFAKDTLRALQQAFKLLYFSNLNTSQAVEQIKREVPQIPEVRNILEFIAASTRGIVK